MIIADKHVGETPLEMLDRIRLERPELENEKLSYAGRLDPMAEGAMLILVGEENKNREKYLGLDKEYLATFLVGVKTDTGDILGLIEKLGKSERNVDGVSIEELTGILETFKKIKQQTYPWFSGQTVDGVKLFDHFKAGNTKIERPSLTVEIKQVELISCVIQKTDAIRDYIFKSVGMVKGDFRQKEIVNAWAEYFKSRESVLADSVRGKENGEIRSVMNVFEIRIVVSSGTFIRALTENFGFPLTLLKLKRTKIVLN